MSEPGWVGIIELADCCASLRARSLDLFEATGAWATGTDERAPHRLFAEACHRHAWHAQLWLDRSPAIPTVDATDLLALHRAAIEAGPADVPVDVYRAKLDELLGDLADLDARVDRELDPSTIRAITLTRADLVDVHDRLN